MSFLSKNRMMKKHLLIILLLFIGTMAVYPQIRTVGSDSERNAEYKKAIGLDTTVPDFDTNKIDAKEPDKNKADVEGGALDDSKAIVTNSLWDNWYGQLGVDMTLMNPYGTNFAEVFPKGKAFGIDIGIGKWFRPEFGVRAKVNWENGIFKNESAIWLKKADQTHGGWVSIIGDAMFNLHNLFGCYNPNRRWNISVYPRMGLLISLKSEGSPLIGIGINNTFRLNDRWSLYADIDYQGVSSALGYMADTGTGHNGFLDINIGVQLDLGYNRFDKVSKKPVRYKHAVVNNGFWDNWFAQFGVGMSLLNPYGYNFTHVFPNGKSFGINMGLGKWFTPEIGLRGGFNWQNGIVGNNHMSWIDPEDKPGGNHDGGGYGAVYLDAFLNLHHIIQGYDVNKKWNTIFYPRVGLNSNFESGSASPLIGLGLEQTFKINNRLRLYADFAYQVTTGEMMDNSTGETSGSNGWFDLNVGVQYELGQVVGWDKPGERRTSSVVVSSHNWPRFIVNTGASVIVAFGVKSVLKKAIKEERPDHSDNKSFPSGHASMAFAAARSIDKEFRKDCIWIPIAGYAAATAIGVERVVNKHHHWYDVVAGAGIGFGSAELTWWLSDLMFGKGRNVAVGSSGNTLDVTYSF